MRSLSVGACRCLTYCRSVLHLCPPPAESVRIVRSSLRVLKIVARVTNINRIALLYAGPAWIGGVMPMPQTKDECNDFSTGCANQDTGLTVPDTDIEHQMTAAEGNLLRAVVEMTAMY